MFKPLLKDIPVFCDLPVNFRTDVLKLMTNFRELNKGEELIHGSQKYPDVFILFKGQLKFSKYPLSELEKEDEEK